MDKQAIARTFGKAAASYDAAAHLQRRVADRLLDCLAGIAVAPAPVVADLGAGTGYCLTPLMERFQPSRLHALDLSADMLALARGKCPTGKMYVADLEALPFADASHDLLFSSLAVQWLTAPNAFLAEAARVLAPGGHLALTTLGPQTLNELRRAWSFADDAPHVNTFAPFDDWRRAVDAPGWSVTLWRPETIRLTFDHPLQLLQELKHLGASHVEGRRGRPGRAALRRMLAGYERFRRPDGKFPASWELLYLVLRKDSN